MPTVFNSTVFRCAAGALAGAAFCYLGILGLLLLMHRFSCCPTF